jgi:(p)ppGpp synthase/HD superfamily hydrolase
MPSLLDDAITLAVKVHAGQTDLAGQPYILHPLRVMLAMETEEERVVAVLHDVLEDGPHWELLFDASFPEHLLDAIKILTRTPHEPYQDYIRRVAEHSLARKVKIADLEDNMDLSRMRGKEFTMKDHDRQTKYGLALTTLRQVEGKE